MEIYQKTPSKIGAMYVFTVKAIGHNRRSVFQNALFTSDIAKSIDVKSATLIYDMRFKASQGSSQRTKKYVKDRKSKYSKQISKGLYAGSDFSNFVPRVPQILATVRSIYSGLNKMDGSKAKYNHKKMVTVKALLKKHFPHQLKGLVKKQPVIKPIKAYKRSKQLSLNTGKAMQKIINKTDKPIDVAKIKNKVSSQEIELNNLINSMQSLNAYKGVYTRRLHNRDNKIKNLSDNLTNLHKKFANLSESFSGFKNTRNTYRQQIKNLRNKISDLESQLDQQKHPVKSFLFGGVK